MIDGFPPKPPKAPRHGKLTPLPKRYVLYRIWGEGKELLYIGRTSNPYNRMCAHRLETPWWPKAKRITYQDYPSDKALKEAETKAINTEQPTYNIQRRLRPTYGPHSDRAPRRLLATHRMPSPLPNLELLP